MESNDSININLKTDESTKLIPKSFYKSLLDHYYFNKKIMGEMKNTFTQKHDDLKKENKKLKTAIEKYNLSKEDKSDEKASNNTDKISINNNNENIENVIKSESQKGGETKSETSLVSSIFKKKSDSDKQNNSSVKNKSNSSKYSQSRSSSYSDSVKKIRNTMNMTETLQGGNTIMNTSTSESESSSEETEESISGGSTSDYDSSDISSVSDSIYETMDGGTITTMTEDEKKKTYKKLSKEMKYFENKKSVDKYDIKKLNFILDGLDVLNKYKNRKNVIIF